jgi:metal-dependent amidase/aminoacylase/carboxypeptidase family protein
MNLKFLVYIILTILAFCQKTFCQQTQAGGIHESIKTETDHIFNKLVDIRRDLHENPELAGNEIRTQQKIKQYLVDLGLEVETNIYGYGVIGILKGTKKGKNIAWRADMDALPNDFADNVAFKSKTKGIQHGCGHDVHMAIALGIAEVLSKHKKDLKGTVYFIFQPEEETFVGAKNMLNSTSFSTIHLDEIYGLHITALPFDQIMVKPNEMFAYQKRLQIKFKDELTKEQTTAITKKIHDALSHYAAGTKPWEIQNMTDPKIGLSNANTIFKDYLIMDDKFSIHSKNNELILDAYLYETNASNLKNIIPKVKQVIEADNLKNQLLSVSFTQENPTIINPKKLTDRTIKTLDNIYGKGFVVPDYGQVPYFNDDFAYFQQKIPGVYFFLGGSNLKKGIVAMNHAPNFTVDEECIKTGVRSFSSLIFEKANGN